MKELLSNMEVSVGYISESEQILEIANDLIEDGITIYYNAEKELEDIIEDNDILQITKLVCEDCGEVTYFIEEVFDEEGYTIPDDRLMITYVDEELLDCIEYTALDTEIVPVEIVYEDGEFECDGDCENCTFEDEELIGDILAQELFDSLAEVDKDDFESMAEIIADKLQEAYEFGRDDSLAELSDAVDAIKSLR